MGYTSSWPEMTKIKINSVKIQLTNIFPSDDFPIYDITMDHFPSDA